MTPRKTEAPPDQTPLKFHKLFQERMKSESELFDQQMQAQNKVHQPNHHHQQQPYQQQSYNQQQQPYQNAGAPPGFHQRDALRQVIVTPRGGEDDNLLHNGSNSAANLELNKIDIHMMMGSSSTSSNDDHHHGSSTVTDTAELLRNLRMAMRNNEMMNGGGGGRNGNELRTHHMPLTPPRQYLQ